MLPARPSLKRSSELSAALARCCHALIGIGVFRAAIDLLQLTGPLFMLEVYDRVLRGRSVPTLVAISALALLMFDFQGISTSCAAASWCASRHLLCVSSADQVGDEVGGLILLGITIATEFLPVAFLVVLISGSSFYLPASASSRPSLRRHLLP